MGQKLGKATFYIEAEPFTNLPRRSISLLWQIFNDIADGFGITVDEMQDIFTDLAIELNISQEAARDKASALFLILDTDHNGLIDALEMFSALAGVSGMRLREIFDFILSCYDFDGVQQLTIDEVTLALKSTCIGLSKLANLKPPAEELIEQLVSTLFVDVSGKPAAVTGSIALRITEIVQALLRHADVWTWYCYFNNSPQASIHQFDVRRNGDIDYECENQKGKVGVTPEERIAYSWNVRARPPITAMGAIGSGGAIVANNKKREAAAEAAAKDFDTIAAANVPPKEPDPWISAAVLLTPLAYAHVELPKVAPDTTLEPAWVYGYQSEKSRNNVRYSSQGHIVYHVSRYAIVYNIESHEQNIFTGHYNEILCLAMHPEGNIVATGEIGSPLAKVLVWNCSDTGSSRSTATNPKNNNTMEILFSEGNFHQHGVIHVTFSPDGKLLGTIGNDKYHSLAVYRWEDSTILFTSRVSEGNCLCCAFMDDASSSSTTFAVGGDSFLYFWSKVTEGYALRPGNFSLHSSKQPITCLAALQLRGAAGSGGAAVSAAGGAAGVGTDQMVSGTASGQLLLWVDRNCVKVVKAHEGAVSTIYSSVHCILTGGKDQRIRQWTLKLEPGATFNISPFGRNPSVRSICMSSDGTTVLFGTRGADIYEISAIDGSDVRGGPIASGHCLGELKCVAMHPSKYEFATCCDDSTIRIWDLSTHTMIKMASFDAPVRAICFSPMGDVIVIGLGGASGAVSSKTGAYVVLNEEDLSIVHEARDSAKPISLVKFSPEGETLAVCADDGPIYLYAVQDEYELIGRCVRHNAPVNHIDFSVDGEWIRTNSGAKDLCFFNTDDASLQSNLPAMRDVQWASHTCIYSWHVKGIHRTAYTGETITTALAPTTTSNYVITGSSYGYVKLFSFPCASEDAECHRFTSHVGTVIGACTTFDQQRMVSAGLQDRCMVLWRVVTQPEDKDVPAPDYPESEDYALEVRGGSDLEADFMNAEADIADSLLNDKSSKMAATPQLDTWLGAVVPPTNPTPQHTAIPDASIRLEHVYGYKCQNMRNNIRYTASGDLVYVAASVGVITNPKSKAQRFFQGHSEAISSFAATSDGAYVATGQVGVRPRVFVWSTMTNQAIVSLSELQMNSITAMAFSSARDDYALLAVVGLDDDHTFSVYNWRRNFVIAKGYGGCCHIMCICFSDNSKEVTACGVKYVNMWNVSKRCVSNKRPVIGEIGKLQPFPCCVYFADVPIVGTSDGNLYSFISYALKSIVKAHDGAVNAMHVSMDGQLLVTGGKDGACRVWNQALECTKEITVESVITSVNARVRSVAFNFDKTKLVVGTRGAEIFEVTIRDGASVASKPLMSGHGMRELWGLATHPTKEEFATCGDDCTIRIWDAKNRTVTRTLRMDAPARAINYSPDGKYLAVGFGSTRLKKGGKVAISKEGSFTILSCIENMKIVHEGKDSDEQIRVIRFSPDGKLLAVGSEDSRLCVYSVKDSFSRKCTISPHKAPIFSADFNNESTYIMTVDTTKRLCFSDCSSGITIPTPAVLRDEKWATWTSPVGWPTLGLWVCQPPNSMPHVIQKSWSGLLLCVGNTSGKVFVVHNPCQERAGFISNAAHAGTVSSVSWLAGDGQLLTTGLKDHTIMQWKCIYDQARESGDEGGLSCDDSQVDVDCGHEFKPKEIMRKNKDLDLNRVELWRSNIVPPSAAAAPTGKEAALALLPSAQKASNRSNRSDATADAGEDTSSTEKPPYDVNLEHVYGIKIADCRQTIRYNEEGHHVYIAGTFGVICDRDNECRQRIYQQHKHVLISIDVNVNHKLVATGELANDPELHIWDACTTAQVAVVRHIHKRGISCISFTPCNHFLITLGQDLRNSVVVLYSPSGRWDDSYTYSSSGLTTQKMLWCTSLENSTNEYPFVVGGNRSIYFFRCSGKSIERCRGVVGRKRKMQPIMCATKGHPISSMVNLEEVKATPAKDGGGKSKKSKQPELNNTSDVLGGQNKSYAMMGAGGSSSSSSSAAAGKAGEVSDGLAGGAGGATAAGTYSPPCLLLTGTVTGHIFVWVNNRVHVSVVAHDGSVNSIITVRNGYVTASKEGLVKIWSKTLKLVHTYNTQLSFVPRPLDFSVHALAVNPANSKLTIGMKTGEVYEVCLSTHSKVIILESHSQRELQAVAQNPHPDKANEFATGGDDGVIRVWDLNFRLCLRKVAIEVACRALCYSPDGRFIAIGIGGNPKTATKDGAFMVLDANTLEIIFEERKAKKYISDIKYSPNGVLLAMGSQEGKLLVMDATNSYAVLHSIEIPPKDTAILRIDFSTDSKSVRLHTSSDELFYYNVEAGSIILVPTTIRDLAWDTYSCIYTWNTQGVWRPTTDNVDVLACSVVEPVPIGVPTAAASRNGTAPSTALARAGSTGSVGGGASGSRIGANAQPGNVSLVGASYQNGDVRLYSYPCTSQFGGYISVPGIGTQCSRLMFTRDGQKLLLLDSFCRTVCQFTVDFNAEEAAAIAAAAKKAAGKK